MPPGRYASQGGRISIRSPNRDQENLSVMRFSSIIYGRQGPKRWDSTDLQYVTRSPMLTRLVRACSIRYCTALLTLSFISLTVAKPAPPQETSDHSRLNVLAGLPVNFEPNQGQAPPSARFVARASNLNLSLRSSGLDLAVSNASHQTSTLHLDFVGANPSAPLVSSDPVVM
jgi:hypothetical protein